jgi:signal transduction histidine kinase
MTAGQADVREIGVLILAPVGRDAAACAKLIKQAGLDSHVCGNVPELLAQLDRGADLAVVAEEALYGKSMDRLTAWVNAQPPWSDFPFIFMTNQHDEPQFTEFRRRIVGKLRNVSFLERPMQAISLQAAVLSAKRDRARQYEARAYLEAQRRAANDLEHLVAQRTRALQRANEQLREEIGRRERAQAALLQAQKLETMGQLVGGVAHDFNNLLMAVISNLELLARKIDHDPRQARLLHGAMEGARRGAILTQRLLAFARKQELQSRATDLHGLVRDMHDLLARSVGPLTNIEVRVDEPLPSVNIDPNQLEMALLNLAVNARDAMPSGGTLTIAMERSVANDGQPGLEPGEYVRLSVQDTGEGMDAATLARAVEPFFSTKGPGKGTGLGLSMIQGLAEQSGGAFRLHSCPGKGTRADLWLPAAERAPAPLALAAPAEIEAIPATILLVDDDALIANTTAALLEDLGHRVAEAHSGEEALVLVQDGLAPDIVVTDYAMPGMTGMDLAVALRRQHPKLPILLATGYAELQGTQPIELPRIAKPYTRQQLSAEITRLVSQRSQ